MFKNSLKFSDLPRTIETWGVNIWNISVMYADALAEDVITMHV